MDNPGKITLLSPLSRIELVGVAKTKRRSAGLQGASLGVLTNMFRGEDLPGAVSEVLKGTYGMSVVNFVKPSLSHVSKDEVIEDMAMRVDCAIVGVCG
jgi:hypothetical protein